MNGQAILLLYQYAQGGDWNAMPIAKFIGLLKVQSEMMDYMLTYSMYLFVCPFKYCKQSQQKDD